MNRADRYILRTAVIDDLNEKPTMKSWVLTKDQFELMTGLVPYLVDNFAPYSDTWGFYKGSEEVFEKFQDEMEGILSEYYNFYASVDKWLREHMIKDYSNPGYPRGGYYHFMSTGDTDKGKEWTKHIYCKAIPLKSVVDSVAKILIDGAMTPSSLMTRLPLTMSNNLFDCADNAIGEKEGGLQNIIVFELEDRQEGTVIGIHS